MALLKRNFIALAWLGLLMTGTALSSSGHFNFVGSAFARNAGIGASGNGGGDEGHGKVDRVDDQFSSKEANLNDNNLNKNTLGPFNAAHASAQARLRAVPNSSVGKIAIYERNREAALAITDPALREQALAAAEAKLELDFHRMLTAAQIDEVNSLLDARR